MKFYIVDGIKGKFKIYARNIDDAASIYNEYLVNLEDAKLYSVEVDYAGSQSQARNEARKNNVDMKVVDPSGPGGGHMVIRLTGTKDNLIKYLTTWAGSRSEAIDYFNDFSSVSK